MSAPAETPAVAWTERVDGAWEAALSPELTAVVRRAAHSGAWWAECEYRVAVRGVRVAGHALLGARPTRGEAEALALAEAAHVAGLVEARR